MLLTRKAEFSASHVCRNPALGEDENRKLYGANANPHGHGHNYVLEVTIEGDPDPVTGMVFDLRELKEIINAEVVDPMDHRFLNHEVPPFDQVVPTTENIGLLIHQRLEQDWHTVFPGPWPQLEKVRIAETERNIFEVRES